METIRKVRRVETVRVDIEECPLLLSDYLEKIAEDIYLTLSKFYCENFVSIRRYYTDRDGNLRPRKEGAALTLEQFAILVDSMSEIESRYWASEEGLSVSPFVQFIGPWKLNIDIFGNLSIWKHYYNQTKNQLVPLNKGISFPLSYYRPLAREIYNLLERYPTLKHAFPRYKSTHSPLEKCKICHPFEPYIPKADEVFSIESLANNNWLISVPDNFNIFRKPYSNNFYLFMSSFLWVLFYYSWLYSMKLEIKNCVETYYIDI